MFKLIFIICAIFPNVRGLNTNASFGKEWTVFPDGNGALHYIDLKIDEKAFDHFIATEKLHDITRFWLYTRKNKTVFEELYIGHKPGNDSHFLKGKPVVIVTHGWTRSGYANSTQFIKDEYLGKEDINVIIVDWEKASRQLYSLASYLTARVGLDIKKMVVTLIKHYDFDINDLHLIGHSLGAHVMGRAANALKKYKAVVPRVTGLDPARPLFEFPRVYPALSKQDAHFVDVIHTCIGIYGFIKAIGHADFYPNGGILQDRNCTDAKVSSVNDHECSYILYAKSITQIFEAYKCHSYSDFKNGNCNGTDLMGMPCSTSASGKYYLVIDNVNK